MSNYKASNLYELSKGKGKRKEYSCRISKETIIKAFVISTNLEKKQALKEIGNKQLIGDNNYIVWLFKDGEAIILKAGTNKKVLEDFQKEISKSKYNKFFKEGSSKEGEDFLNLGSVSSRSRKKETSIEELKDIKMASNYVGQLGGEDINSLVKNEDKISVSLKTINMMIPKMDEKTLRGVLIKLNELDIPAVLLTKSRILDKLEVVNEQKKVLA